MKSSEFTPCVISGGSNSLLRDGWVDSLKKIHADSASITNISIGAATTAMGLYRLLSCDHLAENPIVIWEYALNESNYFDHGQSAEVLLHHTRWFFEICARKGYRVVPLVLYNKSEARDRKANEYRKKLLRLIDKLEVEQVDADAVWHDSFQHLSADELYSENPHYSVSTGFLNALAQKVLEALPKARVPRSDPGLAGKDVRVFLPRSAEQRSFSNRIISCDIHDFDKDISIEMHGRALACCFISSRHEPAICFSSAGKKIGPYSVQISPKTSAPSRQLKHLILWSKKTPPLQVEGHLTIGRAEMQGARPVVQHTMSWRPADVIDGDRGGLIAVLAEADI